MHTVNGNGAVVPMYLWRVVMVRQADAGPARIAHAFSRSRNRSRSLMWTAMCGRTFPVVDFAPDRHDTSRDDQCLACRVAVSPYVGP